MSRSSLYRLFEANGGVTQYIHSQRLLEARATLADPENTQSITILAEDLCWCDLSSFSRAFRREFGYRPSEVQAAARDGKVPPISRQKLAPLAGADFGALLRGF
jgi:AraC-like DNA-binding protein